MKQKEEIAEQQETIEQQIDIVNANRLDIAKQSIMVRGNEQKIQEQEEKLVQQENEFKEKFLSNSDRLFRQGDLIEEQEQQLKQLTLRIEDVEFGVSKEAFQGVTLSFHLSENKLLSQLDKLIATLAIC